MAQFRSQRIGIIQIGYVNYCIYYLFSGIFKYEIISFKTKYGSLRRISHSYFYSDIQISTLTQMSKRRHQTNTKHNVKYKYSLVCILNKLVLSRSLALLFNFRSLIIDSKRIWFIEESSFAFLGEFKTVEFVGL